MRKYLIFDSGDFIEYDNYADFNEYLNRNPQAHGKKITSKKEEENYRKYCEENPNFNKKMYVAILDNKVKRFDEWDKCNDFIKKNKGVKYKSFYNEEDAQAYINVNIHGRTGKECPVCKISEQCAAKTCESDSTLFELAKEGTTLLSYKDEELSKLYSIERELKAVLKAVAWCIKYNEECIVVEYRNQGTEMWANGTWKANKDFSKKYQKEISQMKSKINIEFRKAS